MGEEVCRYVEKKIIRNDITAYDARIATGVSIGKRMVSWKAFSKRGGFHDVALQICQAMKPSVNTFRP